MTTLTLDQLAALLRASTAGFHAEAATYLLTWHRSLLTRADLVAARIDYDHDGTQAWAWVVWDAIPGFVDRAPLSGSEARILRLVAELGGTDTGIPLDDLLTGLDDNNARLVRDAIAYALRFDDDGNRL